MPSLSVERWLALATAGDSQARFHLGKIFSCGLGVDWPLYFHTLFIT